MDSSVSNMTEKKEMASGQSQEGKSQVEQQKTAEGEKPRPTGVCRYRDYARVPASEPNAVASIFRTASTKDPPFPVKLHSMLSNPELEHIVSWLPHGRAWRILKPDILEERVLPLYFSHGRLSSFMRQVNGWGFIRVKQGPDYNSYYNELFLRGVPHLVERMRRVSVSSKFKGGSSEDDPVPDFYQISQESPLPENKPAPSPQPRLEKPVVGMPAMGKLQTSTAVDGVPHSEQQLSLVDRHAVMSRLPLNPLDQSRFLLLDRMQASARVGQAYQSDSLAQPLTSVGVNDNMPPMDLARLNLLRNRMVLGGRDYQPVAGAICDGSSPALRATANSLQASASAYDPRFAAGAVPGQFGNQLSLQVDQTSLAREQLLLANQQVSQGYPVVRGGGSGVANDLNGFDMSLLQRQKPKS